MFINNTKVDADIDVEFIATTTTADLIFQRADATSTNLLFYLDNVKVEEIGESYRYGFNGMEKDDEISGVTGGHLNFKYRMYDSRIARFFAVDPLAPKYPYWTPYQFAGLMPIRYVELEGLEPGEPFATQRDAALNFSQLFNDNSIRDNKEYGTRIYKQTSVGVASYSYTIPVVGSGSSIQVVDLEAVAVPSGSTITSFAHTHVASTASALPGRRFIDNQFSGTPGSLSGGGDIWYAESRSIDGYVATPDGSFDEYDVTSNSIISLTSTGVASDTGPGGGPGIAAKSTSSYTIKSGDTLTSIAKRYHTTVSDIATENSIPDVNKIIAGDTINVTN
ncbi:MAG: DUF4329 domain-containing protein, partial [Candidatus Marinimicrobia bacterium]|nr:DUF4329 domain-containing protein [Candidatus Neomarinimicrobiota bacterium]